ncbi:GNAT family N-acetyltransferase [Candidatus Lokiarchaeum ossiferum]|uniref:GNAT family N-acetyltransferase n=1 Tax=Candidatus Lokiarchaeum ossiferum TaxID=2951803 RepID=UPI00352ED20B
MIDSKNKAEFFQYINQDKIIYFSFINELQSNFQKTQFWMVKTKNQILGCKFHTGISVQMIGTNESIEYFFKNLLDTPKFIGITFPTKKIAEKYIKTQAKKFELHRLFMRKTELTQKQNYTINILQKKDLKAALDVFRVVEPENWSDQSSANLKYDSENHWYGIEKDGIYVSVCWNQIFEHGGHIAFIATRPEYQNRGMATELINFALIRNFQKNTLSIIHVSAENISAYNLYKKMGYSLGFTLSTYIEPVLELHN